MALQSSLEEKLEHCANLHSSTNTPPPPIEEYTKSFRHFITHGLATFLSHPISLHEVELLHLISMIVYPTPPTDLVLQNNGTSSLKKDGTTKKEKEKQEQQQQPPQDPLVKKAIQFMTCHHSQYFTNVSYDDRVCVIQMLLEHLVIPESITSLSSSSSTSGGGPLHDSSFYDSEEEDGGDEEEEGESDDGKVGVTTTSSSGMSEDKTTALFPSSSTITSAKKDVPLFRGALPHLRSSLKAFEVYTAYTTFDASMARNTCVNIAVQSGRINLVKEELEDLIFLLVKDKMNYGCCEEDYQQGKFCCYAESNNDFATDECRGRKEEKKCPHAIRGEALTNLIMRYNGSRYYSDGIFTRRALVLIADAVQIHLKTITRDKKDDHEGGKEEKIKDENEGDINMNALVTGALQAHLKSLKKEEDVKEEEETKEKVKKSDSDDENDKKENERKNDLHPQPCQIVSLLKAAKSLFYFLLTPPSATTEEQHDDDENHEEDAALLNNDEEGQKDETRKKKKLIQSTIKLLCHEHVGVVRASSNLLALAFAYSCKKKNDEGGTAGVVVVEDENYAKSVYECVEQVLVCNVFQTEEEDVKGIKEEENPNDGNVVKRDLDEKEGQSTRKNEKGRQVCKNEKLTEALCPVITATARLSRRFADSLLSFLFEQGRAAQQQEGHQFDFHKVVCRLISYVAMAQPESVVICFDDLQDLSQYVTMKNDDQDSNYGSAAIADIIAAGLSCKMAHYHPTTPKCISLAHSLLFVKDHKNEMMTTSMNAWSLFQLARHAYSTANFDIAHELFSKRMLSMSSTEKSFLWLSALSKSAKAEDIISKEGVLGVSRASLLLDSAIAHIQSLSLLSGSSSSSGCDEYNDDVPAVNNANPFSFQLHLLHHRLDFLNLCVTTRGLCAEMKLIGNVPMKGTRSFLHQRNACHCFYALAARYFRLYSMHGIMHTQQTRTALRTLYALCRFMGDALSKAFAEAVGSGGGSSSAAGSKLCRSHSLLTSPWPVGDVMHPVRNLMRILKEKVVGHMGESVDPIVRASVMIQVLDAVLMCPIPSPRGFLSIKSPPMAELHLSANPASVSPVKYEGGTGLEGIRMDDEAEVVDVLPGFPCKIYVSGKIPRSYFEKSGLSFSQVVVWYKIHYDGPLDSADGDDQDGGEEQQSEVNGAAGNDDDNSMNLSAEDGEDDNKTDSPIATALMPNGRFVLSIEWVAPHHRDGYYKMQVRLGCRDVRFAEWEISTQPGAGTIFLLVKSKGEDESGSLSGV